MGDGEEELAKFIVPTRRKWNYADSFRNHWTKYGLAVWVISQVEKSYFNVRLLIDRNLKVQIIIILLF